MFKPGLGGGSDELGDDWLSVGKGFCGSGAKISPRTISELPNSRRHASIPPTSNIGILFSIFSIACSPIKRTSTESGESLEPRVMDASS